MRLSEKEGSFMRRVLVVLGLVLALILGTATAAVAKYPPSQASPPFPGGGNHFGWGSKGCQGAFNVARNHFPVLFDEVIPPDPACE
jgi:hypothetical protein